MEFGLCVFALIRLSFFLREHQFSVLFAPVDFFLNIRKDTGMTTPLRILAILLTVTVSRLVTGGPVCRQLLYPLRLILEVRHVPF